MAVTDSDKLPDYSCAEVDALKPHRTFDKSDDDTVTLVSREARHQWLQRLCGPQGWRGSIQSFLVAIICVLVIHITFAIWARVKAGSDNGSGILFEGSCDKVNSLNTYTHLVINILSTIILGACSYCMQVLSAPNRKEVDAAHAVGIALQIGVASLTNLWRIDRRRAFLWSLLGITSIPLHIFYNSVIYSSISVNDYVVLLVDDLFVQDVPLNYSSIKQSITNGGYTEPTSPMNYTQFTLDLRSEALAGSLDRLSTNDCITAYGQEFLSTRSNLLLISSSTYTNETQAPELQLGTVYYAQEIDNYESQPFLQNYETFSWMCCGADTTYMYESNCNDCAMQLKYLVEDNSAWSPFLPNRRIDYCYSQKVQARCRLQYSASLMAIVICFNMCQIAVLTYMIFEKSQHRPLLVLGDAISSFLTSPDKTTAGACLLHKADFGKLEGKWQHSTTTIGQPRANSRWRWRQPLLRQYSTKKIRWKRAISRWRWIVFSFLYIVTLMTTTLLLVMSSSGTSDTSGTGSLWNFDIGQANAQNMINWGLPNSGNRGFTANVFVANVPQLVLSIIYLSYNGLFTNMLAAREWSLYAWTRKGLRVSDHPQGEQRSTYWLQLPYRFAIPIICFSSLLHWLVSMSLFLVSIIRYAPDGSMQNFTHSEVSGVYVHLASNAQSVSCAWSPMAIVFTISLSSLMLITAIIAAHWKYKPGIPFAGASSAVISAACHSEVSGNLALSEKRLQWGTIKDDAKGDDGIGHCAFSSSEHVELPVEDQFYA